MLPRWSQGHPVRNRRISSSMNNTPLPVVRCAFDALNWTCHPLSSHYRMHCRLQQPKEDMNEAAENAMIATYILGKDDRCPTDNQRRYSPFIIRTSIQYKVVHSGNCRTTPSGARELQLFFGYDITKIFSKIHLEITTTTEGHYIIKITAVLPVVMYHDPRHDDVRGDAATLPIETVHTSDNVTLKRFVLMLGVSGKES